ncbi:MAG: right-handed parallel beta-helix repeat-containing protein [Chloroflexi bacterium]|nr:right-handed parallel beta-helix repeat-containing protein [Chloroflexota bacterium]
MTVFNIRDYGAVGDGVTLDTAAIQTAIDACHAAGGGRVLVPAIGTYLTGTFVMKSHVELYVERGAVVEASGRVEDYQFVQTPESHKGVGYPNLGESITFIAACGCEDIAFTGGGVIDGGGRKFIAEELPHIYKMKPVRPFTAVLIGCTNVTFQDIVVRDGAMWTLRFSGCEDVLIQGIRLLNDLKLPNSDGIDIDQCRNVRIANCHIVAGDDCICMKSCANAGDFGACENITVTGCTLVSTSTALMVGCEAFTPMRNIIFDSCVIQASNRGLGIHHSHNSIIENVIFSNMVIETRLFHEAWWGRAEPIYICAMPWTPDVQMGQVRHVRFSNILCKGENGVFVYGWEQDTLQDIVFENVRVELDKWTKIPAGLQDIRPFEGGDGMPEYPTSGFLLRNARGVTVRNCEVVWGEHRDPAYRHALEAINVADLALEHFRGESADPQHYPRIWQHGLDTN